MPQTLSVILCLAAGLLMMQHLTVYKQPNIWPGGTAHLKADTDLIAKSAFYTLKMLKLMPHWVFLLEFGSNKYTVYTKNNLPNCFPILKICEVKQILCR